jgi:hypothetical protein
VELHQAGRPLFQLRVVRSQPPRVILAHGVGSRADLPVPLFLALYGAGLAVVVSFLALVLLWRSPKLRGDAARRPLPGVVQAVVDSPVTKAARAAGRAAADAAGRRGGAGGTAEPERQPRAVRALRDAVGGSDPGEPAARGFLALREPAADAARRARADHGPAPAQGRLPALGYWPAAVSLLVFVWLELVLPGRAEPRTVGVFLVLYGVVQLVAALWFGADWFARGDGFEVYSTLLGRMSPFGRREDGRLVVRSPLDGVDGLRPERGLTAVVMVLIGSTGFDGLSRTQFWAEGPGQDAYLTAGPGTIGLIAMIALATLLFVGATLLCGVPDEAVARRSSPGGSPTPWSRSPPATRSRTTSPCCCSTARRPGSSPATRSGRRVSDLFGTYDNAIDYTRLTPGLIANVQVGAIVLGHVLGVVLAHDRAVRPAHTASPPASCRWSPSWSASPSAGSASCCRHERPGARRRRAGGRHDRSAAAAVRRCSSCWSGRARRRENPPKDGTPPADSV